MKRRIIHYDNMTLRQLRQQYILKPRFENVVIRGALVFHRRQHLTATERGNNYKDGLLSAAHREMSAVVRTAVQHAAAVAREEVYKANDDIIKGWQFVATLDDKTSLACQSLDGHVFNIGEGPRPPIHPNCRSTTIPALDEAFAALQQGETRMAKGPDGSEVVPANMTYHEWLKTQPPEFQDAALGKTRAELLRSGELTAEKFSQLNIGRDFQPRTLDELRALDNADLKAAFKNVDDAKKDLILGGESGIFNNNAYSEKVTETLHRAETEIKDQKYETLVMVDGNGNVVRRIDGDEHRVHFSAEDAKDIKNNMVTHNHPDGICSFSRNDLESIIAHDSIGMRAVTSDGRFVSLVRGPDGWNRDILPGYAPFVGSTAGMKADGEARRKYGPQFTPKQRDVILEKRANAWLRENANKYGATFTEGEI